jgi:hypothetical protein
MYSIRSGLILGFHGCDQKNLHKVILGIESLKPSQNKYDWLGNGIYFWDNSISRAFEYASFLKNNPNRSKNPVSIPDAMGAIINLGLCLDLLDYENLKYLLESYEILETTYTLSGVPMPRNRNVGNNNEAFLNH